MQINIQKSLKNLTVLSLLLSSMSVMAANDFIVARLKGKVTFNGVPLKLNQKISKGGTLQSSDKSFVSIKSLEFGSNIFLSANSSLKINDVKDKVPLSLVEGAVRWVTTKDKTKTKTKRVGGIKTKNAVFGVRGTNFAIIYGKLLGESEIVCFDGKVNFTNQKNRKNTKLITKGQWGGLGGRFGSVITTMDKVPKNVVEHFDKLLK